MDWPNYHHLHYFWMIARDGTIDQACEKLRLAQPTLSGQIRLRENSFGEKLLARIVCSRRQLIAAFGREWANKDTVIRIQSFRRATIVFSSAHKGGLKSGLTADT